MLPCLHTAKARRLIDAGDLEGLLGLLGEDEGLLATRDMHGRTGACVGGGVGGWAPLGLCTNQWGTTCPLSPHITAVCTMKL